MRALYRLFAVACLALACVACGTTKYGAEYDKSFDFSSWKTFGWLPPSGEVGAGSPFWPRIQKAVEEAMAARGLKPAGGGTPDFMVSFFYGSGPMSDFSAYGYMYGSWWTGSPRVLNNDDFMKGVVALDCLDAKTKQLAWRGGVRKALSDRVINKPDEMEKILRELLPEILRDFPPRSGRR